ncbi:hypothetical protein MN608_07537 [Microdochium nivale]|nr:hypothetical protein MN608_07537 [Microdochium nivale]
MQPPTAVHSSSSTAPAGLDKFFIPARSTRHRIAAIALYRALIALASSVPLPPDLTEAWNKTQTPRRRQPEAPARNPLVELVRRTFKRNRADTSPRIVAPALHAGYRSLELLRDAAKTEGTPSRDQVVGLVREQLAIRQRSHDARQAWLERHPPPPEDSDQPTEPHHDDQHRDKPRPLPLLVRISPDPTPENPFPGSSTPRPTTRGRSRSSAAAAGGTSRTSTWPTTLRSCDGGGRRTTGSATCCGARWTAGA